MRRHQNLGINDRRVGHQPLGIRMRLLWRGCRWWGVTFVYWAVFPAIAIWLVFDDWRREKMLDARQRLVEEGGCPVHDAAFQRRWKSAYLSYWRFLQLTIRESVEAAGIPVYEYDAECRCDSSPFRERPDASTSELTSGDCKQECP